MCKYLKKMGILFNLRLMMTNIMLFGIMYFMYVRHINYITVMESGGFIRCIKLQMLSLPLPLPTIPLVILLVIINLFSMPVDFIDTIKKEGCIRYICGASKVCLLKWCIIDYSKKFSVTFIFNFILALLLNINIIYFLKCFVFVYSIEIILIILTFIKNLWRGFVYGKN